MSFPALRLALVAGALAIAAPVAHAASFDCSKATTPDEKAVCADPALSNLDTEMATLYSVRMEIPMLMGAKGAAQDEQVDFLATRGQCGADTTCLTNAYNARIGVLNQTISAAMQDYCVKLGIC
jgi:uncharacterized protein